MSEIIRQPVQQRSIEKKNRIIMAAYQLFSGEGYTKTTTQDIAKKAGVSTGIVYSYFYDKRDILIDVLDVYIKNVFFPIFKIFDSFKKPLDFNKIINKAVDEAVLAHKNNAAIHETLYSLAPSDSAINEKFMELEKEMTFKIVEKLVLLGYSKDNINEKVHLAIETIQSFSHECIYDKHKYINYSVMRNELIDMLKFLFVN